MNIIFAIGLFFACVHCTITSKTILVTGGAGFIGSHVSEQLIARGDKVIIIDNLFGENDEIISMKKHHLETISSLDKSAITIYIADICDEKQMETIFSTHKIDTVCHLAARAGVRDSIIDPQSYIETNIIGTTIIFELSQKYKVNNVVFASSSSVYGARNDAKPFNELDRTDNQSSQYGMTKKAGELLASVYHHLYKLPITCLRFFTVYGPRARRDMAPFLFMDAIYNERSITVFGNGSAIRDFTYIDDIVHGIIKAIDNPIGFDIVNLGSGNPILLSNFIEMLEKIIGKKASINYEPIISGDVPLTSASTQHAHEVLGYEPQYSIYEGLSAMVAWYKDMKRQL